MYSTNNSYQTPYTDCTHNLCLQHSRNLIVKISSQTGLSDDWKYDVKLSVVELQFAKFGGNEEYDKKDLYNPGNY